MGFDRRFTAVTLALVALLVAAIAASVWTLTLTGLGAARIVAAIGVVGLVALLVRHVERTNRIVAGFVEAVRHGDDTARVGRNGGASFAAMSEAMNAAMRDLQAERRRGLDELRFREALIEDIPIGLLIVDQVRGVRPVNKVARRLFDRHEGVRPEDFRVYGDAFADRLSNAAPRAQEILTLQLAAGPSRVIVGAAAITRLGEPVHVVAVEPVHGALDALEVGTQSDVVRVLAHEILNSLTPVTSLAGTATILLGEDEPDITEARLAVLTLARRAEGLRRFIDSYRAVARPLEPRRVGFAAGPFADELARLFRAEWLERRLDLEVDPAATIEADPDLLAQVLINLLRNAAQASGEEGRVVLRILANESAIRIEVEDDGPGIPDAMRREIFLPFFTTRQSGTGVGLSLVRQIIVAHGWRIDVNRGALGGALFRLTS